MIAWKKIIYILFEYISINLYGIFNKKFVPTLHNITFMELFDICIIYHIIIWSNMSDTILRDNQI